jgi:hypothetical protein
MSSDALSVQALAGVASDLSKNPLSESILLRALPVNFAFAPPPSSSEVCTKTSLLETGRKQNIVILAVKIGLITEAIAAIIVAFV